MWKVWFLLSLTETINITRLQIEESVWSSHFDSNKKYLVVFDDDQFDHSAQSYALEQICSIWSTALIFWNTATENLIRFSILFM